MQLSGWLQWLVSYSRSLTLIVINRTGSLFPFFSTLGTWSNTSCFIFLLGPQILLVCFSFSSIMITTATKNTFQRQVEPGRILTMPTDGTGLVVLDPWLEPFQDALRTR